MAQCLLNKLGQKMKISNYYVVLNHISYQMVCVVSLQKHFRMSFAVAFNCMTLLNDKKWTQVKDAYPKQKCMFFQKAKMQVYH